jgi:hypothetical protein
MSKKSAKIAMDLSLALDSERLPDTLFVAGGPGKAGSMNIGDVSDAELDARVRAMHEAERTALPDRSEELARAESDLKDQERAWALASENLLDTIARSTRWWQPSARRQRADDVRLLRAQIAEVHGQSLLNARKVDTLKQFQADRKKRLAERQTTIRDGKSAADEQERRKVATPPAAARPARKAAVPRSVNNRRPH